MVMWPAQKLSRFIFCFCCSFHIWDIAWTTSLVISPLEAFSILDAFVCMHYMLAAKSSKKLAIFQITATQIMLPIGKNVVCV
jgi:hypothetical protein